MGMMIPYMKWKIKTMFQTTNQWFLFNQPEEIISPTRTFPNLIAQDEIMFNPCEILWSHHGKKCLVRKNKHNSGNPQEVPA